MANGTSPSFFNQLATELLESGTKMFRADSWINTALGFGTTRDKTAGGTYLANVRILPEELRSLYAHDDIAAKIVNVYPREAMRAGYCLEGFDSDKLDDVNRYLSPWNLPALITDSWIWCRLFGGGKIFIGADDGLPPDQPLNENKIKSIRFLRFYDCRFMRPNTYYKDGPKVGEPETYSLYGIQGFEVVVGTIHETRLVGFPGARTEVLAKRELNSWDYSVLQVAYEAMRSGGNVWKAIEILVSDANQGVFKIKGLWSMITGKQGDKLSLRGQMLDMTRSVARAIMIDQDSEDFERQVTQFTGLADLSDRALKRVASAAEIPVTILMGESPAGLNATGQADLTWFFNRVNTEQVQTLQPPILRLLRVMLAAQDSPLRGQDLMDLSLEWLPLWGPTAKERSEIYLSRAQANALYVVNEVALPEEVAICLASEQEGELGGESINVEIRQKILDQDAGKLLERQPDPAADPTQDPNADPSKPIPPKVKKPIPDAQ